MSAADRIVHNHGTEDGPGLACRERRDESGNLRGECLGATLSDYRAVMLHLDPDSLLDVMDPTVQRDLEHEVMRRGLVNVEKAARMVKEESR